MTAKRFGCIACFASLALVAACTAGDTGSTGTVRDSAGVTIVESFEPKWAPQEAWWVEPAPLLDLSTSGVGPEHEFFRLRDATRLADGTIVVLSAGAVDVRFYSPSGVFETVVGREGDGPGEFSRPRSVHRYRADSLLVFDYWARRITVLDSERSVARTASFDAGIMDELFPLSDGGFVVILDALPFSVGTMGRVRRPQTVAMSSDDGTLVDTLFVLPGFEEWLFEQGMAGPPLGRTGSATAGDFGVISSDGEGVEFKTYSLDGGTEQVTRVPEYPLATPREVSDSIRDGLVASSREGPARFRDFQVEMSESVPATLPGIVDLEIDNEGFVWAAEYHPRQVTGEPRSWLVFDPDGVWLGRVVLPPDFDAYEFGSDYILGRRRDGLDVETVQLLRLTR